ncbi:hypothetical protein WKV53_14470 [Luteolibacter sp. Y139]|uniref:Lipoprotein n=1 Tax=Luteolibacter soli TaxID=3135280 RepID=A0ABU9AVE2_9BACT
MMLVAAGVAVGVGLVSCEGLSVSVGPDGKFAVSGVVPQGKVVVMDEKGKVVDEKGVK